MQRPSMMVGTVCGSPILHGCLGLHAIPWDHESGLLAAVLSKVMLSPRIMTQTDIISNVLNVSINVAAVSFQISSGVPLLQAVKFLREQKPPVLRQCF